MTPGVVQVKAEGGEILIVELKVYADISFFKPGAKIGQSFEVDIPQGATIGQALKQLGIPINVFGLFVNGKHVAPDKTLNPNDRVFILEALNGG
jgi:sulfur carrier protein ThiS